MLYQCRLSLWSGNPVLYLTHNILSRVRMMMTDAADNGFKRSLSHVSVWPSSGTVVQLPTTLLAWVNVVEFLQYNVHVSLRQSASDLSLLLNASFGRCFQQFLIHCLLQLLRHCSFLPAPWHRYVLLSSDDMMSTMRSTHSVACQSNISHTPIRWISKRCMQNSETK